MNQLLTSNEQQPLVCVKNLVKHFPIRKGFFQKTVGAVQALSGVNLDIRPGETLGLVGESGCGKSTLGRCILQLIPQTQGQVLFQGQDLSMLSPQAMRAMRRNMQLVFQNPYSSLNPRMKIGDILSEPLTIHRVASGIELAKKVSSLLDMVGLPQDAAGRYPHEFSGGQRQRVGIARALALNPQFIVADEPVSALDVSIQAQILNLLDDLKASLGLTYLFIAHNLSVVQFVSDRVAVMYLGSIVEIAPSSTLYTQPLHPYTQALLSAIPVPDPRHYTPEFRSQRIRLEGDLPNPANPPSGCRFHTRCPMAVDACKREEPTLKEYLPGHWAACLRLDENLVIG